MSVDAVAVKAPQGGCVVGITSGLMELCHALTKIVTSFIPFSKDGDEIQVRTEWAEIEERLRQDHAATESLVELLRSAARGVIPALQPFPPGPAWEMAGLLRGAAALFPVAVPLVTACSEPALPHTTELVKMGQHTIAERLVLDTAARPQVEAGALLLALLVHRHQGAAFSLSLAGIELLLTALQVLEDMGMPAEPGCSARSRRILVRSVFKQIAPPAGAAFDLSDRVQRIFRVLVEAGAESLGLEGLAADES